LYKNTKRHILDDRKFLAWILLVLVYCAINWN
jgi:hypothetical protein